MTAEGQVQPKAHRIFVALKVAPEIALELANLTADLKEPNVWRVRAADIHLTLVPPWNEVSIADAIARLAGVAERHAPFDLQFARASYGPDAKRPRLLWVDCVLSSELAILQAALTAAFGRTEERLFRPHVTLARMREGGKAIARKHPIDRALALSRRVTSVELMQSPQPGAVGYSVLASVPLAAAEPRAATG